MNKLVFHWQLLLKITTQVHIWISSHQQAILLGKLEDDKASSGFSMVSGITE